MPPLSSPGLNPPDSAQRLRERLQQHQPTLLMALRAWPTAEMVHLATRSGHHAIYLDLQHGIGGMAEVATTCLVASGLGLPALVRLGAMDRDLIGRVLDHGATGVLIPDVEDAATAAALVAAARHPPHGCRSAGGARGHPITSIPWLGAMIESARGVDQADAILATPGLDAVVIGAADLAAAVGAAPGSQIVTDLILRVIQAGQRAPRPVIVAGVRDPAQCLALIAQGAAPCVFAGTDIGYLLDAAEQQVTRFLQAFGAQPA